jgi:PAS domain S-box-containing protein
MPKMESNSSPFALEERLELAPTAADEGVWDWDLTTGRAYLSPQYYRMTGYEPAQVTPDLEFFQKLVHPEDRAVVMDSMNAHLRGETKMSDIFYRMVRQNGSIRYIRGKGRVIERDGDGNPLRMIGVIADETEIRESEAHSELMAHALSSAFEGLALVDLKGRFLYTNAVFEAMFGYEPGELIGREVTIINAGSDADKSELHTSILLALNQNAAWNGILSNQKKDGSLVVTESRVNKFVHPLYGEVWAVLQWIVDSNLWNRRRTESQTRWERSLIHRAAQLHRSIVENSNDAIISKTIDGTITGWNSMAEAIFGYSAIEVIGQRILCLFPDDRVAEEDHLLSRIIQGQHVSHFESVRLKKSD